MNNNKNNGYLLIISAVILWSLSGLRQVTMERAVIICLAEPILNPIWVYLGNGEVPSITTVIGVSFILLGAITDILFTSRAKNKEKRIFKNKILNNSLFNYSNIIKIVIFLFN